MEIEGLLRQELDTRTLEPFGGEGGGNVCKGQAYRVDGGNIYVKINTGPGVSWKFRISYPLIDKLFIFNFQPLEVVCLADAIHNFKCMVFNVIHNCQSERNYS